MYLVALHGVGAAALEIKDDLQDRPTTPLGTGTGTAFCGSWRWWTAVL